RLRGTAFRRGGRPRCTAAVPVPQRGALAVRGHGDDTGGLSPLLQHRDRLRGQSRRGAPSRQSGRLEGRRPAVGAGLKRGGGMPISKAGRNRPWPLQGDANDVARDMRAEGLDTQLNAQWARVRGRLRTEFGEAAFRSWLKPMVLLGQNGSEVRIGVPSRFMRDWVVAHYADRLRVLWAGENPAIRTVE